MKKWLIGAIVVIVCVALVAVFVLKRSEAPSLTSQETSSQSSSSSQNTPSLEDNNSSNAERNETVNKIFIRGEEYIISYENNETVRELMKNFPLKVTMNDLNNNEKYVYLDFDLPTDSKNISRVEAGDVMLFGDNCLVIFYKSFETGYSYTKIGHIDGLNFKIDESVDIEFK